jgi:tRNA G46 methylase TrmB
VSLIKIFADIDSHNLETNILSAGDKREKKNLRLIKTCSLKVLDKFKRAYLEKVRIFYKPPTLR